MISIVKEIFTFKGNTKENAEKIRVILIALFGAMLPFDMFYTTFLLYLIAGAMLIDFNFKKIKLIPKQIWVFTLIYLLSAIGYVYSTDLWRAGYVLERQLAIFIFPILLPLSINCNKKNLEFIFSVFAISCVITVGFLLLNGIYTLELYELPIKYLFTSSFFNLNFTKPIGIHPTYLSLYVSLAIMFLLDRFQSEYKFTKMLIILMLAILLSGLFFLASRTNIIASAILLVIIFPLYHLRNKGRYFFLSSSIIVAIAIWSSQSAYVRSRFTSEFSEDLMKSQLHYVSKDPDSRIMRWECAWELIEKRPVFGYGTGDEIGLMMKQYLKYNMMLSYKEEFNTHNQFIALLLKNGIVGLVIFLGMLGYFFTLAIQSKNFLYLSFLMLLSIGLITENIVDANKGIFFFALFNTLLGYEILSSQKSKTDSIQK